MQNRVLEPLGIALPLIIAIITDFTDHNPVFAQLTPDNTLGAESSIVTPQQLRDLIQGGAIRGNALFHSFDEFNVGDGRGVFFDLQNADILNIFTRVTGGNVSNILGTLGVLQDALNSNALGNANLFLLNPSGITFGGNASLQLNGSFFATTADGFGFDDFTFSASGEEAPPPLLTISIPRFLSFRDNPGNISVSRSNLTVNQGQSLSLVGGNITVAGSGDINNVTNTLTASDGRIEIGSVSGNGLVSLTETGAGFVLGYEAIETFGDITFNQFAFLDTSGEGGGGSIQLQGREIRLRDRTRIFADTEGSGNGGGVLINSEQLILEDGSALTADTLGSGQGGSITVNASNDVQVIGTAPDGEPRSTLAARTFSTGNAGDLTITTPQLLIRDGAQVTTLTVEAGNGGNLAVNATDSVQVIGRSADGQFGSALSAQANNSDFTGNAGDLTITTSRLLIQDGAQVDSATFGAGDGGNLVVNATDSVQVIGRSANGQIPSILSTQASPNSTGNAGNLTINTSRLLTQDGSQVSANTFGAGDGGNIIVNATDSVQLIGGVADLPISSGLSASANLGSTGNAGDLTVTTSQLVIQDGARIRARTLGSGDGGDIKINVDDTILIEGIGSNGRASGIFSSAGSDSTGNPGNITIDPQQVIIRDGGAISVNSQGAGIGGNLTIISDNLTLENGSITAATSNTDGGNVILNIGNLLLLRNGSFISAEAGGEGNGGNLTLDTNFLVAFPANNDISANANQGNGGNIDITATGIYGIAFREASTDLSDITATSQFGISGTVNLNTPETQINQEQVEQPEELVDSSDMIAQSVCYDFGGESQLANTGRGGVPQIPGLVVRNSVVNVELVDEVLPAPPPEAIKPHHRTRETFIDSEGNEFTPAMGAVMLEDGTVEFVDYNPGEVYRDMYASAGCSGR